VGPMLLGKLFRKLWTSPPAELWQHARLRSANLLGKPDWMPVTGGPLAGGRLFLQPHGAPAWAEMESGKHDAFLFKLFEHELASARTAWDIGAHMGYHALAFASLLGKEGHVVAFEPCGTNLGRLRKNLEGNPQLAERIELAAFALGNEDGSVELLGAGSVDTGQSTNAHLATADTPLEAHAYDGYAATRVDCRRIDSLLAEGIYSEPDFLKIDVEGAESLVLEGAKDFLRRRRPVLAIEIHTVRNMHAVARLLAEIGYTTRILEDAPVTPSRCFLLAT